MCECEDIRTVAVYVILKINSHSSLVLRPLEGDDPNLTNPNPKLTLSLIQTLNLILH